MTTSMAHKASPTPGRSLCDALAAELRAETARRRLSQRDMATLMGKPRGWVERRWSGEKRIDADDMEAISAFFGWTPTDYLARAEALRGTTPTGTPTVAYVGSTLRPTLRPYVSLASRQPASRPRNRTDRAHPRR